MAALPGPLDAKRFGPGSQVPARHGLGRPAPSLFTAGCGRRQPDLRHVADQLRGKWPKLATFMDETEHDVLAYMTFPAQHRVKLYSTNPLERLNKEVKRRADVVGIFPNEASIIQLIGAILLEQNDEWQLQSRYMQVEAMAELNPQPNEAQPAQIPLRAA
ncbi:putative transposase [Solidesulfovibrio magneticus RS-1]|uniref:Mutator family transposase n=1 Tax=Solidesulfovibrio magneticus (strain ATCC 700980 / DSM 13731 / RS-1) TaxID=573370 RepID=C4XR77_SOLM1|nr:putative transposase [Solidesulfovibrio magneticus RS-1]